MEQKNSLSVVLAVYNEEKNIQACLDAVQDIADEIIVVDGGSTDTTVAIASRYTKKVIVTDNPPIFHINKQKALERATCTWILQLDADEIITQALKKEILQTIEENNGNIVGYYIPRKNYFWGHWMRKGGQYPDYVIRLVKRGYAAFPCKSVHEQIAINGSVGWLTEPMIHNSYNSLEEYWKKAESYTTLTAKEMIKSNLHPSVQAWLTYMIVKPIQTFFTLFLRHKGFFDGIYGLVFAYYSGLHFPIAYRKFIQMKKEA